MRPARNQVKKSAKLFRRRFGVRSRSASVVFLSLFWASRSGLSLWISSLIAVTSRPFRRAAPSRIRRASFSLPTAKSHRGDSGVNLWQTSQWHAEQKHDIKDFCAWIQKEIVQFTIQLLHYLFRRKLRNVCKNVEYLSVCQPAKQIPTVYYIPFDITSYFLLEVQALQLMTPLLLRDLLLTRRFTLINIFLFSAALTSWPTEKRPRHQVYPSVAASHSSEKQKLC